MQYFPTYLFKYNKIIYHLKAYKVAFLNFWKENFLGNGQIQNGVYNDVIIVFLITILDKNFVGKESHGNKRFCKKQKVFYMYKKLWRDYYDSFQNGGLWSYGSEKPIFLMK